MTHQPTPIRPRFDLKAWAEAVGDPAAIGQEIELEAPAGGKPQWQAVFDQLHYAAAVELGPGVRYELRTYGGQPAKSAGWYSVARFDQESRWINEPSMGEGYHVIGRYTTPHLWREGHEKNQADR